jgi:hypothetical protein
VALSENMNAGLPLLATNLLSDAKKTSVVRLERISIIALVEQQT